MHPKSAASSTSSKSKNTHNEDKHGRKVRNEPFKQSKVRKHKTETKRIKETHELPKVGIRIKEIHSNFPQVIPTGLDEPSFDEKSVVRRLSTPRKRQNKKKSSLSQTGGQAKAGTSKASKKGTSKRPNLGMLSQGIYTVALSIVPFIIRTENGISKLKSSKEKKDIQGTPQSAPKDARRPAHK